MSAVQLARVLGAAEVYAVDMSVPKLEVASTYRAIPINPARGDPVGQICDHTDGKGVDVALEVVGTPETMCQAVRSLAIFGRAVLAGITDEAFEVNSYIELLGKEAEIIGCADHLSSELEVLIELVRSGKLNLSSVVTDMIPLEARAVNEAMDALENSEDGIRTVIVPGE